MRPRVSSLTVAVLFSLLLCVGDKGLLAQIIQADTSLVRIDSLVTDSTTSRIKLSWDMVLRPSEGDSMDVVVVSNTRAKESIEFFEGQDGHFRFQQGGFGMPTHLSSFGLPTSDSQFELDDLPIENPLTGEIDWDFAPLDYATTSSGSVMSSGHLSTFSAKTRTITHDIPYTEMKYFSGSNGLQAISAIHSQSRQRKIFGSELLLNASLRYRGGAATGEFTNSNYRHREIGARMLFAAPTWFVNFDLSSGNHRNGVHRGVVLSDGDAYDSIYDRFGASVNSSSQRRTKKRSHIRADLGVDWMGRDNPLEATLFWQNNLNRFFSDTTAAIHVNRVGFVLKQNFWIAGHAIEGRLRYWKDGAGSESSWDNFGSQTDFELRDRFEFMGTSLDGRISFGSERGEVKGGYSIGLSKELSGFNFLAEWRDAKTVPHLIYQNGFSPFVSGVFPSESNIKSGQASMARIKLGKNVGDLSLGLEGFYSRSAFSPIPLHARLIPWQEGGPLYHDTHVGTGIGSYLSWREFTQRGFYLKSTLQYYNSSSSEAKIFLIGAIPEFSGRASMGLKYELFERELLMHSYLEINYQSSTTALILGNSTSLLTWTYDADQSFSVLGAQSILNFWTDAEIRGATIFAGVENILAPWLDAGSSSLYFYPLPDLAVRVGLLWPING